MKPSMTERKLSTSTRPTKTRQQNSENSFTISSAESAVKARKKVSKLSAIEDMLKKAQTAAETIGKV